MPLQAGAHYRVALLLILLLQFGPSLGLAGFLLTDDPVWTLNGVVRDVCLLVLALLALRGWLRQRHATPVPSSVIWALLLSAAFAVLVFFSPSALNIVLLNLRRVVYLPLLFAVFLILPWRAAQVDALFRWIVGTSVAVALLGGIERLLPDAFWIETLQIEQYTAASTVSRFGNIGFYEGGRFFNWDFVALIDQPLRRMVSTYIEPTTLGAGMAAALSLILARRARGHRVGWMLAVVAAAGVLTLSKAFAAYLLLLLSWRLLGWPGPQHLLSMLLASLAAGSVITAAGLTESTFAHSAGLSEALAHLAGGAVWGEGLGGAGNYGDQGEDIGYESGLGNVIGQAGLLAILPLIWVHAVARDMGSAAAVRQDPGAPWLAAWLVFWLFSFLFSASSQGVGGNALGFMALALYLHPASANGPGVRRCA